MLASVLLHCQCPTKIISQCAKCCRSFDKTGRFVTTDDDKPLAEDMEFIALCDETLGGLIRFNGPGEPPERHMGLIMEGYAPPERKTLGDLDPAGWDLGLNNEPQDPYQHQMVLPLQEVKAKEMFCFVTSSRTGRRAVGNLLRHHQRALKTNPHEVPIVRLGKGGFQHKDTRVGFVSTPVFIVVGRTDRSSAATPDTSLAADLNDEIRF